MSTEEYNHTKVSQQKNIIILKLLQMKRPQETQSQTTIIILTNPQKSYINLLLL